MPTVFNESNQKLIFIAGRFSLFPLLLAAVFAAPMLAANPVAAPLNPIPAFPIERSPYALIQPVQAQMPLTVVGPRGAFLGQQNGDIEAWIFPVKLFDRFHIFARLQGEASPIDVTTLASTIDVEPDHTTITYSQAAFTIHEILFAPQDSAPGTGVVALFQIDSVFPIEVTFSLIPEVKRAWPAPNYGEPDRDWVPTANGSGYYLLHLDYPDLAAALAIPGTRPGAMGIPENCSGLSNYNPLTLVLDFDPKKDRGLYFPLLMAVGNTAATATDEALTQNLRMLDRNVAELYGKEAGSRKHFFDSRLTIHTPDPRLDLAYRWALLAMDKNKIRLASDGEMGFAAGFGASGNSTRPGFGWFFGRDTLWATYALNADGDFASTREGLEFLFRRQRTDGKIMHEFAQTAPMVDWSQFGDEYAAADSTPLLLMAAADYYRASGDAAFIHDHWGQLRKAWQFEIKGGTDGDGIYDNANGTGWVESWPGGMPHQEIYLAALDQQASTAMMRMAVAVGDATTAGQAQARAVRIAATIEKEYPIDAVGTYPFSRNADGKLDTTATIYPAVAWWDGDFALPNSEAMFARWASHDFSTDWGTRDLGEGERYYNPLSYHQGSVWPLFTGWTALAEYRTGHVLSGYAHLMQNADLTYAQDLGSVTEVLSGAFYQRFDGSTPHQLWSSAMVVTPILRGIFGLELDAPKDVVFVTPHLPAAWNHAELRHVALGSNHFDLSFQRKGSELVIDMEGDAGSARLASHAPGANISGNGRILHIPLPAVEVFLPSELPLPGSRTAMPKVISEIYTDHIYTLVLEAEGGSTLVLPLRTNGVRGKITVAGAALEAAGAAGTSITIQFPHGEGYQQMKVAIRW